MRLLAISICILIFTNSFGQMIDRGSLLDPKQQCKKLGKKRKAKSGNSIFGKKKITVPIPTQYYNQPVISPQRIAEEQALMAMQEEESNSNTELKFKTFEADNIEPVPVEDLPPPVSDRHAEIRQKVLEMIKNGQADQPITESLYFITAQDEFAYVDFEPFLMAVEFALQGKMVLVEGHTDSNGADKYNLDLSMQRVRQIERLMTEIGVPAERVAVIGYGETMPSHDNSTEEGRQKNRRVDFKIY